jgi:hypothetical protein
VLKSSDGPQLTKIGLFALGLSDTANRDQCCVRQAEKEQVGGVQFGFPGRPNSPPELAARLRRIDSPFGHLDVRVF